MAKTHTWFGTKNDTQLIVSWLNEAGATRIDGTLLEFDGVADGREFPIHFPSIGPVEFWPTEIILPELGDDGPKAKRAILASIRQKQCPGQRHIDVDQSAVAGFKLPEFRDARYWVGGEIWFPTSHLQDKFAGLNRICQKLERFFGKHATVYDNRRGDDTSAYAYQLCMTGVIRKVSALPEAFELIQAGAFMVDPLASEKYYKDFRRRLQLSGHEASG